MCRCITCDMGHSERGQHLPRQAERSWHNVILPSCSLEDPRQWVTQLNSCHTSVFVQPLEIIVYVLSKHDEVLRSGNGLYVPPKESCWNEIPIVRHYEDGNIIWLWCPEVGPLEVVGLDMVSRVECCDWLLVFLHTHTPSGFFHH